jgi:hypothetical protein
MTVEKWTTNVKFVLIVSLIVLNLNTFLNALPSNSPKKNNSK